eukprot:1160284-Pelagomonas_calceolata.AAC.9
MEKSGSAYRRNLGVLPAKAAQIHGHCGLYRVQMRSALNAAGNKVFSFVLNSLCLSECWRAAHSPMLVLDVVELLKQLDTGHHLLGQRKLNALVCWPEAGGEHLYEQGLGGGQLCCVPTKSAPDKDSSAKGKRCRQYGMMCLQKGEMSRENGA